MIKSIVYNSDKFEYPVFLFEYLHSYLLRYAIANGSYDGGEVLVVYKGGLEELYIFVEHGLRDLLQVCYVEPTHKNRSKHPSRYQKISVDERIYIINYRTDPVGNISYGISLLLKWIKEKTTLGLPEEERATSHT